MKPRPSSASNRIIRAAPVIGSVTLASGESLRVDLQNTGNSIDMQHSTVQHRGSRASKTVQVTCLLIQVLVT